jgi:hypothetical protein
MVGEDKKKQWVEAAVEMMRNPIDRKEMREWAKQYDWDNITDQWDVILSG